ncbi:hypothetical protein L7F22_040536 [Adiantum nelumboides]|nr:hypothetical protein [Adiantum nelumboides]
MLEHQLVVSAGPKNAAVESIGSCTSVQCKQRKRRQETDDVDAAGRLTVSIGGGDIDVNLLGCMGSFLKEETCAGICSIERGGVAFNLHFQMVARLWATSLVTEQEGQEVLGLGQGEAGNCACAMSSFDAMEHAHISWDGGLLPEGLRPATFPEGGAQY